MRFGKPVIIFIIHMMAYLILFYSVCFIINFSFSQSCLLSFCPPAVVTVQSDTDGPHGEGVVEMCGSGKDSRPAHSPAARQHTCH